MINIYTYRDRHLGLKAKSLIYVFVLVFSLVLIQPTEDVVFNEESALLVSAEEMPTGSPSKSKDKEDYNKPAPIPDWVGIGGLITAVGAVIVSLLKTSKESREVDIKDLREQRDALNAWIKTELEKSRDEIFKLREINTHLKLEKEKADTERDEAVTQMRQEIERLKTIYNQTQLLITVMEKNPESVSISEFKTIGYR